jgi:hypothetical protein
MLRALCIAVRKHKCNIRNEQRCNLEGRCLLCEEKLENIVFGKKNCWKESTAWGGRSKVTEDAKFVICCSSGVREVAGFMWAVRYCIVPACLLCGRNSTFKYVDLHFVLQMSPLCSQSNSNTNFWLKYYNCLKFVLCCLFKPVFFHHAVLYTSKNLSLRPAYFDREDELAFLGNF